MIAPVRIQLRRTKGWRMPENTVKVTRPSLYGNPYLHADPADAVAAYRKHCQGGTKVFEIGPGKLQFAKNAHPDTLHWAFPDWLRQHGLPPLRGKNLACWCAVGAPCHADVLLELANTPICEAV